MHGALPSLSQGPSVHRRPAASPSVGCPRSPHECMGSSYRPVYRASAVGEYKGTQSRHWTRPHSVDFGRGSFSIDVLGVGQAMVDINATVPEELLEKLELPQGGRRVLRSIEERSSVLQTLDDEDCPTELSAGGSLANSLFAVGQLARAAAACSQFQHSLSVSMTGSCGNDHLGQFFASQMQRGGVAVDKGLGGPTGTVLVLTDSSGERSFLSYFGDSAAMSVPPRLRLGISQAKLVVIEGYLWEMPGALQAIKEVVNLARMSGSQVALTAGDPGVVRRRRADILEVLSLGVDIMFCNKKEACELLDCQGECTGREAAASLGSLVSTAVVTDGAAGSCVGCMGRVYQVDAADLPSGAVTSTNGAGDAYCGGFLFALSHGQSVAVAARFATLVAAAVVRQHQAQLTEEDAAQLVRLLPSRPAMPSTLLGTAASMLP